MTSTRYTPHLRADVLTAVPEPFWVTRQVVKAVVTGRRAGAQAATRIGAWLDRSESRDPDRLVVTVGLCALGVLPLLVSF